jgi:hypothetical protein
VQGFCVVVIGYLVFGVWGFTFLGIYQCWVPGIDEDYHRQIEKWFVADYGL